MKNLLFLFTILLTLCCCKNDDDNPTDPIDQLPPATQTGEQTFGCLINGEAFLPDTFGSGRPNAFYQFSGGKYTLGLSASKGAGRDLEYIIIGGIDIEPIQETSYQLLTQTSGNFYALYNIGGGDITPLTVTTSNDLPGIITITNFDPENFIISGTFEFTVLDDDNNEIKITDGRFDLKYTN